ncbi:MAG TPA: hypothetical protein ENJ37_03240 [Deltaproteobacteria bacterium]|nr:hypothetical protein [Deltaproteobacteria bacterium]
MDRTKGPLTVLFAALCWTLLVGMGRVPGPEVPLPDVDFRATIIDSQDIATECRNVSWDGQTFFSGLRGKGAVSIPFEKVRKVEFVGEGGEGLADFQVTLKSGEVIGVSLEAHKKLTGTTSFGSYRIDAIHIKEIVFR